MLGVVTLDAQRCGVEMLGVVKMGAQGYRLFASVALDSE